MGLLGGAIAKPLMVALGTLLVSRIMSGGGAQAQPTAAPAEPPGALPTGSLDGGLLGGLGGLLQKLESAGHGETVNSWVGPGQNKPIEPGQLGAALGQNTVSTAAQQSGMTEQELLQQLAQHLPQIVGQLTANGSIPSLQELATILAGANAPRH
jgi:uncharacterized protein YidB (DUF937 family)